MVEGGPPAIFVFFSWLRTPLRRSGRAGAARARGRVCRRPQGCGLPPGAFPDQVWLSRPAAGRGCGVGVAPIRAGRVGEQAGARGRGSSARGAWRIQEALPPGVPGVGGARGRERAGPTRSHPEPGRDPAQRRRVLWGRPHGRRGRRGHPPPPTQSGSRETARAESREPAPDAGWSSGSSLGSKPKGRGFESPPRYQM
jgi:hypothetical protein